MLQKGLNYNVHLLGRACKIDPDSEFSQICRANTKGSLSTGISSNNTFTLSSPFVKTHRATVPHKPREELLEKEKQEETKRGKSVRKKSKRKASKRKATRRSKSPVKKTSPSKKRKESPSKKRKASKKKKQSPSKRDKSPSKRKKSTRKHKKKE